jgi:hypothetical protein
MDNYQVKFNIMINNSEIPKVYINEQCYVDVTEISNCINAIIKDLSKYFDIARILVKLSLTKYL